MKVIALFTLITLLAVPGQSQNLLKNSQDLNAKNWNSFKRNTSIAKQNVLSPENRNNAFHVTIEKTGYFGQIIRKAIPGKKYVFSVWLKSATGKPQTVTLIAENNPPAKSLKFQACKVADKWQQFSIVSQCPEAGNKNFRFSIRHGDVYVYSPSVKEQTADTTNHSPSNSKNRIVCWGDSLTQGAGGKGMTYPKYLQQKVAPSQYSVLNKGIGGQTSSQIRERCLAATANQTDIAIIWAGRNNYHHQPNPILADIAKMVKHIKTKKFLILSIINMDSPNESIGASGYKIIENLNNGLAKAYPNNFLDIRKVLINAYNPNDSGDAEDNKKDIPPSSLRSDKIHLNSDGYKLVAEKVMQFIDKKGWMN